MNEKQLREIMVKVFLKDILPMVETQVKDYQRLADDMFARLSNHIAEAEGMQPAKWGYSSRSHNRCGHCGQVIKKPRKATAKSR